MFHLEWSFDWPVQRAVAVSPHGTYVISGEGPGQWLAKFTRADTEQFRRTAHPVGQATRYPSMADAMRACQRHAEQSSTDSSDRLSVNTPMP
jgi:hypothetical protein